MTDFPFVADINSVIVVGAGVMGEGIAQSFAEAGLDVQIVDLSEQALARCKDQIAANLNLSAEHDVLSEPASNVMERVKTALSGALPQLLRNCDLVVETASELLDIKRKIFAQLDEAPKSVLLASNTSSFTVSEITQDMKTPERVIGLHYFNPAHIIPAVEVHKGEATNQKSIDLAMAIMRRVNKIPVLVRKEIPGFIINRLTGALSREIDHLVDEGVVLPEDLDEAIKASLGFRLSQVGMIEGRDFIGLDTDVRVSKKIYPLLSDRNGPSQASIDKVEKGDFGVKSGKGFFDYEGRSREDILLERNKKLLAQRRLFLEAKEKNSS